MKKAIYICNECLRVLSNEVEELAIPHLSLQFSYNSGIYEKGIAKWHQKQGIAGTFQFCDGDCLGTYFNKLMHKNETTEATRKSKKIK